MTESTQTEMLCVSRKEVQELYNRYFGNPLEPVSKIRLRKDFEDLFGSKCLPDELNEENFAKPEPITQFKVGDKVVFHPYKTNSFNDAEILEVNEGEDKMYLLQLAENDQVWAYPIEVQSITETHPDANEDNFATKEPKPAEPKFKEGDIVRYRYDGKLYTVVCKTGKYYYVLRQPYGAVMIHDVLESDLEPYTEPTANYLRSEGTLNTAVLAGNYSSASTCDKQFDNIIKDGFKNHNRLHIAAILAAGMLASEVRCYPVDRALELADKLIAECEKGVNNA